MNLLLLSSCVHICPISITLPYLHETKSPISVVAHDGASSQSAFSGFNSLFTIFTNVVEPSISFFSIWIIASEDD